MKNIREEKEKFREFDEYTKPIMKKAGVEEIDFYKDQIGVDDDRDQFKLEVLGASSAFDHEPEPEDDIEDPSSYRSILQSNDYFHYKKEAEESEFENEESVTRDSSNTFTEE